MSSISRPGFPSQYRRLWHHAGFILVIAIVWLSLKPEPIPIPADNGDKLGHFFAYTMLMNWFSQLSLETSLRAKYAMVFAALGAGLEVAQHFTGYRSADVLDALANFAGVLFGWAIAPPRLPGLDRAWGLLSAGQQPERR